MDFLGGGEGVGFAFLSENGISGLSLNWFPTPLLHVCLSHNLQPFFCLLWGLGGLKVQSAHCDSRTVTCALAHKLGDRNSTPFCNQYNAWKKCWSLCFLFSVFHVLHVHCTYVGKSMPKNRIRICTYPNEPPLNGQLKTSVECNCDCGPTQYGCC